MDKTRHTDDRVRHYFRLEIVTEAWGKNCTKRIFSHPSNSMNEGERDNDVSPGGEEDRKNNDTPRAREKSRSGRSEKVRGAARGKGKSKSRKVAHVTR